MANIASGKMRHKVSFEQDTGSTRNAVGEQVASWSETKKAWCEIRTLNGQELVRRVYETLHGQPRQAFLHSMQNEDCPSTL